MIEFYPFADSFDEIKVKDWVYSAIELTNFLETRKLRERFLLSKVKMTKEAILQTYGFEIETDTAYIYLNGYYIEIDVKGFFVTYESFGDYFKTIEEAEKDFFNNYVKHEFND